MDKAETQETYSQTRENRRDNQGWTIETQDTYSQTRENRRDNQGWTIQRTWQNWVHKTKTSKTNNTTLYVLDTTIHKTQDDDKRDK